MKTFTCNGYATCGHAIIAFLSIIFSSSLLYSQSSIVYDTGTSIDVGSGADVCADVITVNGTYSGSGTFCNGSVAVETDSSNLPDKFDISQNYPNPFNPTTKINFSIPSSAFILLKVFDVLGNEVSTLINEDKPSGNYEVDFNAGNLPSGVYLYKLQAGSFVETKKMLLLK